jgi:hypothetical protein
MFSAASASRTSTPCRSASADEPRVARSLQPSRIRGRGQEPQRPSLPAGPIAQARDAAAPDAVLFRPAPASDQTARRVVGHPPTAPRARRSSVGKRLWPPPDPRRATLLARAELSARPPAHPRRGWAVALARSGDRRMSATSSLARSARDRATTAPDAQSRSRSRAWWYARAALQTSVDRGSNRRRLGWRTASQAHRPGAPSYVLPVEHEAREARCQHLSRSRGSL